MAGNRPARTRHFKGPLTDTARWDHIALRPGDVIVATPPKSGTTWTQSIVMMLILGQASLPGGLSAYSPWFDAHFRPLENVRALIDRQTHRRCLKTHSPLDAIVYDPACTYLAVYRHPVDVHFSMQRHARNAKSGRLDFLSFADDREGFAWFLETDSPDANTDSLSLAALVAHYQSFARWAHLPNVHLLHYSDLTRDLPGSVSEIAARLGTPHPPEVLAEIAEATRFATVQAAAKADPERRNNDIFHDRAAFFDSATSGKWVGRLGPQDMARYAARLTQHLPDARDRAWLETGGRPSPRTSEVC